MDYFLVCNRVSGFGFSNYKQAKLPSHRKRAMSSSTGMKLGGAPSWLRPLLGARFFQPCAAHPQLVKNECNHYCLNCAGEENAVCCPMCLSGHRDHHVVQIRQSSRYGEVIRVAELEEVADMSLVQPYVVNHDRAVYLNPRPQALQHAVKYFGPADECLVCSRRLVEANFRYCSLGCKLTNLSVLVERTF